jgi:hypothetical protein
MVSISPELFIRKQGWTEFLSSLRCKPCRQQLLSIDLADASHSSEANAKPMGPEAIVSAIEEPTYPTTTSHVQLSLLRLPPPTAAISQTLNSRMTSSSMKNKF